MPDSAFDKRKKRVLDSLDETAGKELLEEIDQIATEVQVYLLPDDSMEVHMIGEYVAVCWRLKENRVEVEAGSKINRTINITYERSGEPYINFLEIREHNGEYYRDEDSPVEGGFTPREALIVAEELQRAYAYLEEMGKA